MKRIILSLTGLLLLGYTQNFALAATPPVATAPDDTIVITMPDQSKMTIFVKNKQDLANFKSFNVDSLIASLSDYMNSGLQPGADTTLMIKNQNNRSMSQVQVKVAGTDVQRISKLEERMIEMADQLLAKLEERSADPSLTEQEKQEIAKEKERLLKERQDLRRQLALKNQELKNFGNVVNVNVTNNNTGGKTTSIGIGNNATAKDTIQKKFKPWYHEFEIDLGFNTFHKSEAYVNPATGQSVKYDLRPFGSRYVSLNWVTGSVIGGKGSPFRIQSGVEFNFNNFMWDNNLRIESVDGKPVFYKEEVLNLSKSKLAVTYVTVPVMAGLQFKNSKGKDGFRFMAGGFAGYRIGTHSKIKYTNAEGDTKKDKGKGSFGLEDYQYGVSAQIGYRNFVLFSKYNLSDLFKENRGPQAQIISFGITI